MAPLRFVEAATAIRAMMGRTFQYNANTPACKKEKQEIYIGGASILKLDEETWQFTVRGTIDGVPHLLDVRMIVEAFREEMRELKNAEM